MIIKMEVREVVHRLCRCLANCGFSKVPADYFRRAKHNDSDPSVLATLRTLCEELCLHVLKLNGREEDFLLLRELCRRDNSRDLLIKIGWILARFQIIDDIVRKRLVYGNYEPVSVEFDDESFVYDRFLCQLKRCQLLGRSLLSEQHRCVEKLHRLCLSTGESHFEKLELRSIARAEDKTLINAYVERIANENKLLKNVLLFKVAEEVFWKWMDNVVTLRTENGVNDCCKMFARLNELAFAKDVAAETISMPSVRSFRLKLKDERNSSESCDVEYVNKNLERKLSVLQEDLRELRSCCQKMLAKNMGLIK